MNPYQKKCLKEKFFEAVEEAKEAGIPYGVYTPKILSALRDMAKADVYPDGKFGDIDCNVWSMFR